MKELETTTDEFNKKELAFLKRERELTAMEKRIALEREEFVNQKTTELQTTIREEVEIDFKGKLSEKDKKIERLETLAEELQKKAKQGSMEEQGEAFEQELDNYLRDTFKFDDFEPVPKGKKGADILHRVKTNSQIICGTIVWEAKYTNNWREDWVAKLKDDQRQLEGETVGIIVTKELPKSVKRFGYYDGVWVTDFFSIVGLATAIRTKFLELHQTKSAIAGRSSIQDHIYNYVTGSDFTKRIIATGEALKEMKGDIDKERAAMEKNWSKREKQLFRIVHNMAGVYGDLNGLGANLQRVQILELDSEDSE